MNIEIKDNLIGIKEQHNQILEIVKENCKHPFFLEVTEKLKEIEIDNIITSIGSYLYNILYPISYKTLYNKPTNGYLTLRKTPAVGKWFGVIVNKNISYYKTFDILLNLCLEHISLVPYKKRHIVQEFYDLYRNITMIQNQPKTYTINNIDTNIYETLKIMTNERKSYINLIKSKPLTKMFIKTTYSVDPNIIINLEIILPKELNLTYLTFGYYSTFKEVYSLSNIEPVKSTTLEGLTGNNFEYAFYANTCLTNPEIYLTDEIRFDILDNIKHIKTYQEKWNELKMKYAHLLLQKGKI